MGAWAFLAQYSDGEFKSAANPSVKTDLKGYQLGAQYSLSKRTTAYAYYGDDEAKRTGVANADRSGFALGIRHTF
jgi:predicted porin